MMIRQFNSSTMPRSKRHWLLMCSLALNLFFFSTAVSMILRAPAHSSRDRNVFVRIERLASVLSPSDASSLRTWVDINQTAIQNTQTTYRTARNQIREVLRREPFDERALHAAIANTRAARQNFDQIIEEISATAAAQMSPASRHALASQFPGHKYASTN